MPERERFHGHLLLSANVAVAASHDHAPSLTAVFSPELAPASAVAPDAAAGEAVASAQQRAAAAHCSPAAEAAASVQPHARAVAHSSAVEAVVLAQPHAQAASRDSRAAAAAA
ncbi:MAG: hypothetical protein KGL96_10965, partial [Hyphomicrobiales bacterium]|nr:hypothetical protein [Hyphomicrobiales bacterium]